ncbi:MAG: kelch repeat-containing protein [Burkholderiaceae bacterium]
MPVVTAGPSMAFARANSNTVMLPNGEVLLVSGNSTGELFSDNGAVMTPEVWSPVTNQWRQLRNMAIPRTYHSTALLLKDARVLSAGGGLRHRCVANSPGRPDLLAALPVQYQWHAGGATSDHRCLRPPAPAGRPWPCPPART